MALFDNWLGGGRKSSQTKQEPSLTVHNDIERYIRGAVRFVRTESGLIQPYRFTAPQMEMLEHIGRARRAIATSGVIIDFLTTGNTVAFDCSITRGLDRMHHVFETVMQHEGVLGSPEDGIVDGIDVVAGGLRSYTTTVVDGKIKLDFDNPSGERTEVRIFLPYIMSVAVGNLAVNGELEPAPPRGYLLALGDSITQGFVVGCPSLTYPAQVATALGLDLVNQGIAGHVFDRRTLRGLDELRANPPRVITVAYGTNDWARKDNARAIQRGAERYLSRLMRTFPGVPIYVISPLWRADEQDPVPSGVPLTWVGDMLANLCSQRDVLHFVDGYHAIPKNPVMLADGRLHPGSVDAGLVADAISSAIIADGVSLANDEGATYVAPEVESAEAASASAAAAHGAEAAEDDSSHEDSGSETSEEALDGDTANDESGDGLSDVSADAPVDASADTPAEGSSDTSGDVPETTDPAHAVAGAVVDAAPSAQEDVGIAAGVAAAAIVSQDLSSLDHVDDDAHEANTATAAESTTATPEDAAGTEGAAGDDATEMSTSDGTDEKTTDAVKETLNQEDGVAEEAVDASTPKHEDDTAADSRVLDAADIISDDADVDTSSESSAEAALPSTSVDDSGADTMIASSAEAAEALAESAQADGVDSADGVSTATTDEASHGEAASAASTTEQVDDGATPSDEVSASPSARSAQVSSAAPNAHMDDRSMGAHVASDFVGVSHPVDEVDASTLRDAAASAFAGAIGGHASDAVDDPAAGAGRSYAAAKGRSAASKLGPVAAAAMAEAVILMYDRMLREGLDLSQAQITTAATAARAASDAGAPPLEIAATADVAARTLKDIVEGRMTVDELLATVPGAAPSIVTDEDWDELDASESWDEIEGVAAERGKLAEHAAGTTSWNSVDEASDWLGMHAIAAAMDVSEHGRQAKVAASGEGVAPLSADWDDDEDDDYDNDFLDDGEGTQAASGSAHSEFDQLVETVARLRQEDGCPWDREQTHESITRNLIAEAYEAIDAINEGSVEHLREELGDVLEQVLLHSQIAADEGEFTIDDVCRELNDKLIRRHPHVFGDEVAETSEDALRLWNEVKQREREERGERDDRPSGLLDSIPKSLPALAQCQEISVRAARLGFEWDNVAQVWEKVSEESQEFVNEPRGSEAAKMEFGDLLFALVNVARFEGIDAEEALAASNAKFRARWESVERTAYEWGRAPETLSPLEFDLLWKHAKSEEDLGAILQSHELSGEIGMG